MVFILKIFFIGGGKNFLIPESFLMSPREG